MMKLNIQKFAVSKSTTFQESNIDILNNQSDLTITIKFSAGNNVTWFESATLKCVCNGVTKTANVSLSTGGTVKQSFTFSNINHNADGKKNVSWSWSCPTGTSVLGTISDNGTKTLTTIARASKVYATNANIGDFSTITINKYKDSFTTTLQYKTPQDNDYVTMPNATKISGTSYAFEIPEEWYNKIPNAKSFTCSVKAITYNGNTNIGSNTTSFSVTTNEEECKPIIISSIVDTNTTCTSLTGSNQRYIRNKSLPKITWSAEAQNGSTIISQQINNIDRTSPYTMEQWIDNIFLTITDSRGYISGVWYNNENLDIVDYFVPTITANGSRLSPTSDKIIINIYGSFFNGYFDVENINKNELIVSFKYKELDATDFINGTTINVTKTDNTFKIENYEPNISFDYQKSYVVKVEATDTLSSSLPYTFTIIKGIPVFDWDINHLRSNELFIADKNVLLNDSKNTGTEYNASLGGTQINGDVYLNGNQLLNLSEMESATGNAKIGILGIEWGIVSVKPEGGYGSISVNLKNNYKYPPLAIASAGVGYSTITNVGVFGVTTDQIAVFMTATNDTARTCRYLVIGEIQN